MNNDFLQNMYGLSAILTVLKLSARIKGEDGTKADTNNENALRERLRTHKFFTKDQCFNLDYRKFSIKGKAILIHIQNI